MSYYPYSAIIIVLIINLTFVWTFPSIIKNKSLSLKNDTPLNILQIDKRQNSTTSSEDHLDPSHEEIDNKKQTTSVVVLTSLSGIYVWWPVLFGGDDSFHLLLNQEDVPRFHDVAGDDHGHIYLTSPHERTVYRLKYSDGWWISNFSNHSVMNSIRSEMPLFVNIHYISSIAYVYGHSDIQIIDLLERPRTLGSAPFMKRLRELSPNLRISDMIIDQLTADGYIIGDSFGWCTIIRCSLSVNQCVFLFKIPSSYDNRPYPCTATIDFSNKIIYLSLEEKILAVHLNEQTSYDRRFTLAEKRGPRSTLGYDDIVTHNNILLYTDVLRPLLHICTLINSNPCFNISLTFPPPQRSILPLRLSIIQVSNLRPPILEDDEDQSELHINQSTTLLPPMALLISNKTTALQRLTDDATKSYVNKEISIGNIWMLILGICMGLLLAGVSFFIYYITCNKNRPKIKQQTLPTKKDSNSSTTKRLVSVTRPLLDSDPSTEPRFRPVISQTSNPSNSGLSDSNMDSVSDLTLVTSSSSSYRIDIVL